VDATSSASAAVLDGYLGHVELDRLRIGSTSTVLAPSTAAVREDP